QRRVPRRIAGRGRRLRRAGAGQRPDREVSTAMSTATINPPVQPSVPSSGTTVANVARSEWTKLWSVRSTRWTLLATVLVSWGFTTLFAWGESANWSQVDPVEKATFVPTATSLGGLYFGQLA